MFYDLVREWLKSRLAIGTTNAETALVCCGEATVVDLSENI